MRISLLCMLLLVALNGCNDQQSTLTTFGAEAREIRQIAIVMAIAAAVIAAIVAGLYIRAVRAPEGRLSHEGGMRLVLWFGATGPTVILAVLLLYALPAMRPRPTSAADLTIHVEGEQFWWRVAYQFPGDGGTLLSANEVRIPVGWTVAFELTATDVIHSFWIPGLAGKMDMIPGRTNRLVVRAEKAGRYRGVCAEFCGLSHALMAFDVIAMTPAEFDAWRARSDGASRAVAGRGRTLFNAQGCGGCHAIRGTAHRAAIGPDLSRFGERLTLGAGILQPTTDNVTAFIRAPQAAKPGVRMPAYPRLSQADARAIADYLKGLR
jgi:cytochrome c oxidase subunit 2